MCWTAAVCWSSFPRARPVSRLRRNCTWTRWPRDSPRKGRTRCWSSPPRRPPVICCKGATGCRVHAAPAGELLEWQLVRHLADCPDPDALGRGEQILKHPLFLDALGILPEALRPSETELVAERVAQHVRGEVSRDELLDSCGHIARRQAREWFSGAADPLPPTPAPDREGADAFMDDAAARVREASFRIALAVLDGEALSSVADAAELLAQQILAVRMPGRAHGRPVFAEDLDGLLAACRAEARTGEEVSVGGVAVPVRTVSYRGTALAGSVLAEVWHRHHAARGPLVRWLRGLAGDPRPQVWVRAAVVAGELATADLGYGFAELIRPLSAAEDTRRRYFAATALHQAAGREPHRSAVRGVVEDWADAPVPALRWTAALALGSGRIVDDTRRAMELLCGIGGRDDGAHALVASFGATRLVVEQPGRGGGHRALRVGRARHRRADRPRHALRRTAVLRADRRHVAGGVGRRPGRAARRVRPVRTVLHAAGCGGPAGCGSRAGRRGSRAAPGRTP